MNFRVVENPEPEYDINEVIKDYTNLKLTVKQIREKHGIGRTRWQNILKEMEEKGVTLRDRNTLRRSATWKNSK